MNGLAPVCPYCQELSQKMKGDEVYVNRPDLADKTFYRCIPCDALVGCHPGTDKPMGRLADSELRYWRKKAHAAFDPIWQQCVNDDPDAVRRQVRESHYVRLAQVMCIAREHCHIGMFDVEQCQQVVDICQFGEL